MVALVLDGLVGFPAGLSPTSSFASQFFSFVSQAGCWLVSDFLSFNSHFFSFVSHFFSIVSSSFHLSLRLGACGRAPGWLVSHFLSFVSHFFSFGSHFFSLSPRIGACGRVPGRLVSHFLSFVSHFFSFVSQAGCLWSGSRLACLPLPLWSGSRPASFHLSPTSFQAGCFWSGSRLACLPLPFICFPLLFICLPGWVLVVGFPAGLPPTSLHLSPTFSPTSLLLGVLNSFLRCVRPVSLLVSEHFYSFVSQVCHCWCPPFSGDHAAFLVVCPPNLSLVVSALFRWSCSISMHLSPRSVTAGVRPFPPAM